MAVKLTQAEHDTIMREAVQTIGVAIDALSMDQTAVNAFCLGNVGIVVVSHQNPDVVHKMLRASHRALSAVMDGMHGKATVDRHRKIEVQANTPNDGRN